MKGKREEGGGKKALEPGPTEAKDRRKHREGGKKALGRNRTWSTWSRIAADSLEKAADSLEIVADSLE